jgi:uncharacterized protein (TIGR02646 family)
MIKVIRLAQPRILLQKQATWTAELCEQRKEYYRTALLAKETASPAQELPRPKALKSRYAHAQVKKRLAQMFVSKCAYCESKVTAVSYLHVEHFRPQSTYPWLAYEWSNLLFACEQCNSSYKRDRFPLADGNTRIEDPCNPCDPCESDEHMLVDPCSDNPEDHFDFEDEWLTCKDGRGLVMRDVCGLNREDLRDSRREWLALVVVVAKAFLAAERDGRRADSAEFARKLDQCLAPRRSTVPWCEPNCVHSAFSIESSNSSLLTLIPSRAAKSMNRCAHAARIHLLP